MNIREHNSSDLPAMVELLKASLGDSMIPKSEALWQWKHEQNPFGASYVLLAEEDGQLIGLRAFLQWQWKNNQGIYKAIRAVDTATHPNHQGKGLFKKLTMQLVEHCKAEGIHFVFNTPNEKSRPGYLKMGWIDQGPMPVSIKPLRMLPAAQRKINKQVASDESFLPMSDWSVIDQLPEIIQPLSNKLQTAISKNYIQWRYGTNPLFPYFYITDHQSYLLIYRMKTQGPIRELRIADAFALRATVNFSDLHQQLKQISKQQKADVISMSYATLRHWKKGVGSLYFKTKGPLVTLRQLALDDNMFQSIQSPEAWNYSLGDMELF